MRFLFLLALFSTICFSGNLTVSVETGESFSNSIRAGIFKTVETPQIAIWLEEKDGTFLRTLFVTEKTATGKYKDPRPSALPIWMHSRAVDNEEGGLWPTKRKPLTDAETGASPDSSFSLSFPVSEDEITREIILRFEVNNAGDFNDSYHRNVAPASEFYSNDINGQPSLLFQITLSEKLYGAEFELSFEGSGDAAGRNGVVNWEAPEVTDAKTILESVSGTLVK